MNTQRVLELEETLRTVVGDRYADLTVEQLSSLATKILAGRIDPEDNQQFRYVTVRALTALMEAVSLHTEIAENVRAFRLYTDGTAQKLSESDQFTELDLPTSEQASLPKHCISDTVLVLADSDDHDAIKGKKIKSGIIAGCFNYGAGWQYVLGYRENGTANILVNADEIYAETEVKTNPMDFESQYRPKCERPSFLRIVK